MNDDEIKRKHQFREKTGDVEHLYDVNNILNEARADERVKCIAHMRVARAGMCLKDRQILLVEIEKLNEMSK